MKEIIVDQSSWDLVRLAGADRVRFLQGMCTSNVESLAAGEWQRTMVLNAKARVLSFFDVVCRENDFLLICDPGLGERTIEVLDKFVMMDEVELSREAATVHRLWTSPEAVWTAPPIFSEPPAPPATDEEVRVRRIEAGLPVYGIDISEAHFAFETPLARGIDYKKGCYVGQEPVARVHARGNASKLLRGLTVEGEGELSVAAVVKGAQRADAGAVTSAAISPDFGSIALAYVARDSFEVGAEVEVEGRAARISDLPFTLCH